MKVSVIGASGKLGQYMVSSLSTVAVLIGSSVPVGGTVPIVDGHNHEGISASRGQINTSKLDDLKARGIEAVVMAVPLDRSETADVEGRIADEMERLREESLKEGGFSLGDDPAASMMAENTDIKRVC